MVPWVVSALKSGAVWFIRRLMVGPLIFCFSPPKRAANLGRHFRGSPDVLQARLFQDYSRAHQELRNFANTENGLPALPLEWLAERRHAVELQQAAVGGDDAEHDDGDDVGQARKQLRGQVEAGCLC